VSSEKPVVLFLVTALVLLVSIVQGTFLVYLMYRLPDTFQNESVPLANIFLKLLVCLYIAIGCIQIFRIKRLGIYLLELGVLYSLIWYIWNTVRACYYMLFSDQLFIENTAVATLFQVLFLAVVVSGHLFYLWCLRSEKASLYFCLAGNSRDE
jgi:hypothetical protein